MQVIDALTQRSGAPSGVSRTYFEYIDIDNYSRVEIVDRSGHGEIEINVEWIGRCMKPSPKDVAAAVEAELSK